MQAQSYQQQWGEGWGLGWLFTRHVVVAPPGMFTAEGSKDTDLQQRRWIFILVLSEESEKQNEIRNQISFM